MKTLAVRIILIYFFVQSVPLDWNFFQQLLSIDWSQLHYGDIFNIAHYMPQFYQEGQYYSNWAVVLVLAIIGGIAWHAYDKQAQHDLQAIYYWVRAIVRSRLAIGILAYGFLKFFPLQSPYPSLSILNTPYGDFTRWKLFSITLGIVPSYERFLGLFEILLALGLFYRKTASLSAFLVIIFTGNVFMSNLAYEGGEHVYSLYLIALAVFVLAYDLQRIISLVVLQKPTAPGRFNPPFTVNWLRYSRWAVKLGLFGFFVLLYGFKTGVGYYEDAYQYPRTKVLPQLAGLYNVEKFQLNDSTLPYSKTDPVRWQDVVFEEWNTISIKSNRPVIIDSSNVEKILRDDAERTYELEGSIGRHYYRYEADTVTRVLTLYNKNKHYSGEKLVLHYDSDTAGRILLRGINENNDSVNVVLSKIDKKYLLKEVERQGRRKPLTL